MVRTSTIVSITVSTVVAGALGYAVYFDYRRRNDPAFRSKLRKEAKRSEKASKRASQQKQREDAAFIEQTVQDMNKPGVLPTTPQEMEEVFMQSVSIGEALVAQGPEHYKTAAAAFYRGLKVYPKPAELLIIYRQAVPEEALDIVRQMVAKDSTLSGQSSQEDAFAALLAKAAAGAPRAGAGASLEEIDDDDPSSKAQAAGASAAGGAASATSTPPADLNDGSSKTAPSVSSQEWEKVSEHQGEELNLPIGSYAAAAATPVTMPHEREQAGVAGLDSHQPTVTPGGAQSSASSSTTTTTTSSAPAGSYAAAAETHVDIPVGQGTAEHAVPQPYSEDASKQ